MLETTVGIRELKAQLSTYLAQVKAGAVQDTAGNNNTVSNTASLTWDRTVPVVSSIAALIVAFAPVR